MSDKDERKYSGRESRSASRSRSEHGSEKSASRSPARSPARSYSRGSRRSRTRSRSRSRSESRSRSHRSSRRRYSRSRSRSHRRRSRSRSYTPDYYRKRSSHSHSPMSSRRRHIGNRRLTSASVSVKQANPDPNCCLGVFGLSLYTTERDLREVFSKYGPLADVCIVYDQQSRRSRGFAFVYFENVDDAKEAKERANGMELDGRRIRVDFSITKRPHTPTPGIYMGRPTYSGSSRRREYYERGGYERYDEREYYSSRSYRSLLKTRI
ncbi:transformer-2 protein homolog beta isoform X3 [Protopterus annectens]|uniref:transformer-2 protein homolog beta isoform X3 n=1 Tax=Protopterus annectens TaxID=7888 RepID=UPI001CFC37FA|nr:transformer-2 protein homolog beta isoform X3 [Protopterus annectens]